MRISNMVQAVDAHACGEPGRVIVGGVLDVPGTTMFDKMCYLRDHADGLRKRMLREPRGYPAANCNVILPSSHPEADAGFVHVTDAASRAGAVTEAFRPPADTYPPVVYPAAVVTGSREPALAAAFIDHLAGRDGQAVLARLGFQPPPPGAR